MSDPAVNITLLGEHHLFICPPRQGKEAACLETQAKIWALMNECRSKGGLTDITPGMNNLTLYLNADQDPKQWQHWLASQWQSLPTQVPEGTLHKIPVRYGGDYGPDLASVARFHQLSVTDIIHSHTQPIYRVMFLGFLPGFAYMSGLPTSLHTPRLEVPRQRVAAGSVGIGGAQTGIYPCNAPGGWQLIGQTEVQLFNLSADSPCLFAPGDRVQFVSEGH